MMLIQIEMQAINSGRVLILFLCLLLSLLEGQNLASKLFVTDQIVLWQGNNIVQYQQIASGYTFTSTFANPPPFINKIYACVNGYNILNQNTLSFTVESFLNFTSSAYQIDFNPQSSTIIYSISFSIIATTLSSTSFVTIERQFIRPSILSSALRPFGSNIQTFTFNGDIIFTDANYQVRNFISYMSCYQSSGVVGVSIDSMSIYSVGSHTFTVNVQVENGAQLSLCVIVSVFINKAALSSFHTMFAADSYQVYRNYLAIADSSLASLTSTDFATWAVFGPTKSRNCTIGVYTMKLDTTLSQKSLLFTYNAASPIAISSQIAGTGQMANYQVFCLIDCEPTAFYYSTTNRCDFCNNHIPDCYACLSETNCIDCGVNAFFDQLHNTCRCKFGEKVKGGCSTIHDCYEIGSSGLCVKCITGFSLSSGGNKCSCSANNYLVNDYCISFPGCLTAKLVSGVPICIACRLSQHYLFQTVNDRCVCEQGYAMVNGLCLNICGNGKTVGSEECDDGNSFSGDGCSNCVVQRSYICNNSLGVSSICTYQADNAEVTLIQTYRDNNQNAGIFVFEVKPAISNLNKMNFASSISISTTGSLISKSKIDYSDGILIIKIYFTDDLEKHMVKLILNFDQKILKHKSIQADFYVKSMNSPMLLFKKFLQYNFIVLSLKILSVLAIVIFFIGSWAHKMIGVQTIHIFQFIFFMSIYQVSFDDLFISSLQTLKYTSNYPDFFYDEMASIKEGGIFQSLTFAASFIGNFYIIGTLQIFIFITLLVINLRKKFQKDELTTEQQKTQLEQKYAQMQEKIYSICLFPLVVGYYLQCFFAVEAQTYRKSIYFTHLEFLINAFLIMLFIWVSAATIFKQIFFNLRTTAKAFYYNVPNRYIAFYLLNILINLIFFNFSDRFQYDLTTFAVWNFLYFTVIAIYRPYQHHIHNFHILFNQVVYIYWFIILIYQDRAKVKLTDDQKHTALTVLISLLALSLLLGLVRSIYEIVNKGSQRDKIPKYFEAEKEKRDNLRVKGIGKLENVLKQDVSRLKKYRLKDQARVKRHENRSYINAARNAIGLHNLFPSPKNAQKTSPEQAHVSRGHTRSKDEQRLDKQFEQRELKQIAAAKEIEQIKTKLRENLLKYKQRLKQEQF